MGQVFSSNAGACVFDGERDPGIAGERRHSHAAALGSELDRVADQVREDLRDTLTIGQDVWKRRRGGHLERYSSSGGQGGVRLQRLLEQGQRVCRNRIHR